MESPVVCFSRGEVGKRPRPVGAADGQPLIPPDVPVHHTFDNGSEFPDAQGLEEFCIMLGKGNVTSYFWSGRYFPLSDLAISRESACILRFYEKGLV